MPKVILDTNFLLVPEQFRLDVIEEIRILTGAKELAILDKSIQELKTKKIDVPEFVKNLRVIKTLNGKVDDILIKYGKNGYTIATNDQILRKRLKENNVQVIFVRNKRYLEIE